MSMPKDDSLSHADAQSVHAMVDGGLFANDPELAGLWVSRMDSPSLNTYRLLSVGTGSYTTPVNMSMHGGIVGWLSGGGLLISTMMEANKSFTESVSAQLARFSNVRRYKLSCDLAQSMELDDISFPAKFNDDWEGVHGGVAFKQSVDMKALNFFYQHFFLDEPVVQQQNPTATNEQAKATVRQGAPGLDTYKDSSAMSGGDKEGSALHRVDYASEKQ